MSAVWAQMAAHVTLRVDFVNAEAVAFACERWHYSRRVPRFKAVRFGVWEDGRFMGVVVFGQGATPEIGTPYGLDATEICELTRVALDRRHATPVSRVVSICIRMLRKQSPGLRLVVSFADFAHGHHGGIYQAMGWIYSGTSETHAYVVNGRMEHPKTLHSRYGIGGQSIPWLRQHVDPCSERIVAGVKHRYLLPMDESIRSKVASLSKPYPKRTTVAGTAEPPRSGRCKSDPFAPSFLRTTSTAIGVR